MACSDLLASLSLQLREKRKRQGLSLREAAAVIGVPTTTLHRWEQRGPSEHLVAIVQWIEHDA